MAKFFGIHHITLKPGVSAEEFEKFLREEKDTYVHIPGMLGRALKGLRGERDGQYAILVEAESVEVRDKLFTDNDASSAEAIKWTEDHPQNQEWMTKFLSMTDGFGETFTDYEEIS